MNQTELIKQAMNVAQFTQKDLQQELDLKSQSSVSAYLRSDMRVNTFVRILNAMGYQVTVTGHEQKWVLTSEK